MTHPLRDYQDTAIGNVEAAWEGGARAVCLVAPTGAGKTRMGSEAALRRISRGQRVIWLAHRTELIRQAAARLQGEGIRHVGIIAPWSDPSPYAPCQVASLQTLAARPDYRPPADLVIPDECHHVLSDEWRAVFESAEYANAQSLGLTATPERSDGRPLGLESGGIFDRLVVAASYSQLITAGHILPCKVFHAPERLTRDLAQDPVVAYSRYAPGQQAFCFCSTVSAAHATAAAFNAAGIPAAVVDAKTPANERAEALRLFEFGGIRVLCNVYTLTEGVDVPAASCCILARKCLHATPFLQMCGRVLRPYPGQTHATLIDLSGSCLKPSIGLPTEDREYSLTGRGIRRLTTDPLRQCPKCGGVMEAGTRECENIDYRTGGPCGYRFVPGVRKAPRYLSLELREVYAGSETPEPAKRTEYERLLVKAADRGVGWLVHVFEETFGHKPPPEWLAELPEPKRREEYNRLRSRSSDKGYAQGWAAHQFKAMFGAFPPWSWTRETGFGAAEARS